MGMIRLRTREVRGVCKAGIVQLNELSGLGIPYSIREQDHRWCIQGIGGPNKETSGLSLANAVNASVIWALKVSCKLSTIARALSSSQIPGSDPTRAILLESRGDDLKFLFWFILCCNMTIVSTLPQSVRYFIKHYLRVCVQWYFWMRLAIESVDWVKQIVLSHMGVLHLSKPWIEQKTWGRTGFFLFLPDNL